MNRDFVGESGDRLHVAPSLERQSAYRTKFHATVNLSHEKADSFQLTINLIGLK